MGACFVCPERPDIPDAEILDHLRVIHPDVWGAGPTRWPDGRIVVYDTALTPGDFGGRREIVHMATKGDGHVHCCGRTPFELPRTDRVTLDPHAVTCPGPRKSTETCVNCDVEGCAGCWGVDTHIVDDWRP